MKLIIDIAKLEQLGLARLVEDEAEPETLTLGFEAESPTKQLKADAIEILNFLNEKAGRNYEPVAANIRMIESRIKEYGKNKLQMMIARKCAAWKGNDKMEPYLRPKTLFNQTNCANYMGELVKPGG